MKQILLIVLLFSAINGIAQNNYQRDSLAQDGAFQQRVRIASLSASKDLLADPQQPVYVTNYCQLIVSYPFGDGGWLNAMSYGVASSPGITLEATDSDIQFTVNSIIVNYAKAYYKIVAALEGLDKILLTQSKLPLTLLVSEKE